MGRPVREAQGTRGVGVRRRRNMAETLICLSYDAAEFARAMLGWTPDDKQALVLRSTARKVILNCSRQWGKSTVAATKILHVALTRPGALVLVVSENMGQTAELFQKIDSFLSMLEMTARPTPWGSTPPCS